MVVTLRSALGCSGEPELGAADQDGAILLQARRENETTCPELVASNRCRLRVVALGIGSRWSEEAADIFRQLDVARAREESRSGVGTTLDPHVGDNLCGVFLQPRLCPSARRGVAPVERHTPRGLFDHNPKQCAVATVTTDSPLNFVVSLGFKSGGEGVFLQKGKGEGGFKMDEVFFFQRGGEEEEEGVVFQRRGDVFQKGRGRRRGRVSKRKEVCFSKGGCSSKREGLVSKGEGGRGVQKERRRRIWEREKKRRDGVSKC